MCEIKKPRLIVSGAFGEIGALLCKALKNDFEIAKIDIVSAAEDNAFNTDISDFSAAKSAFEKIGSADCLIHLAADRSPKAEWESVLKNNIVGTHNIYECARIFGIPKVIFASSFHVTAGYHGFSPDFVKKSRFKKISDKNACKPVSDYGSSKVFGETIARQYHENFNINSICLRIGNYAPTINLKKFKNPIHRKSWISTPDLIHLFQKSIDTSIPFGIYYGFSKNKGLLWDLSNARKEIGFKPNDNVSNIK